MIGIWINRNKINYNKLGLIKIIKETNFVGENSVTKPKDTYKMVDYPYGISVNGDGATGRNFLEDPYFKFYSGKSMENYDHLTRIGIYEPKYIIHNHQEWKLSSSDKRNLIKILNHVDKESGKTIWELTLEECINTGINSKKFKSAKEREEFIKEFMKTKMPDYTKLK